MVMARTSLDPPKTPPMKWSSGSALRWAMRNWWSWPRSWRAGPCRD